MNRALARLSVPLFLALALEACGTDVGETDETFDDATATDVDPTVDGDLWHPGEDEEPPEPGKADAVLGSRTVPTSADTSSTAVWSVTRQWSAKVDVDFAPYFRKADNLTWNQAYAQFVERLETVTAVAGYKSYKLTTPWGRTFPIAALECAEQAMFLRITFAAWFQLPFFLEATDGSGTRMFAGHFGVRTLTGKYRDFPEFKTAYRDYTATAKAANWPHDANLRKIKLSATDDDQSGVLGVPGAKIGAYLDELHANKRVGYFTRLVLLYFGSTNLVSPANTFHLKPEGLRAGDILLERWQRAGIGHALNVKYVEKLPNGQLLVNVASGSMPRRQSLWEGPSTSREYFLDDAMGGPGKNWDGVAYATLGGGLHRWRVATVYNGAWTNTVPGDSSSNWISSSDTAAIAARPARFATLLGVPDPATQRAELTAALASARNNLRNSPSSCASRTKRETILGALADLEGEDRYWSREQAERAYRTYEDYVFPDMVYNQSKVCCFNSSTAHMFDIAMKYNKAQAQASQQCRPPVPFSAENFATFKAWAVQQGRGAQWVDWRADEPCPQANVTTDTATPRPEILPYCTLRPAIP